MTIAEDNAVAPVEVSITVDRPVATVFHVFTARMGDWWPLATHSVAEDRAATCIMEPAVGGRILERDQDGGEHEWGRIIRWEPPGHVAFTWYPGRGPEDATTVTVTLVPAGDSGCRLTLVHDGWAIHGANALPVRQRYDQGWRMILEQPFADCLRAAP